MLLMLGACAQGYGDWIRLQVEGGQRDVSTMFGVLQPGGEWGVTFCNPNPDQCVAATLPSGEQFTTIDPARGDVTAVALSEYATVVWTEGAEADLWVTAGGLGAEVDPIDLGLDDTWAAGQVIYQISTCAGSLSAWMCEEVVEYEPS